MKTQIGLVGKKKQKLGQPNDVHKLTGHKRDFDGVSYLNEPNGWDCESEGARLVFEFMA